MKHFGILFEEKLIPLDQPETDQEILKYSPGGKVPVLIDDKIVVWESMAIAEYLNEKFSEKKMWPQNPKARALARCISNEMHAGFANLRHHLSHDLQKRLKDFDYSPAKEDIARIFEVWKSCLKEFQGPFLFGPEFTIADAMYAPVVNRLISYGVPVDSACTDYVATMRALPAHQEWIQAGEKETYQVN